MTKNHDAIRIDTLTSLYSVFDSIAEEALLPLNIEGTISEHFISSHLSVFIIACKF